MIKQYLEFVYFQKGLKAATIKLILERSFQMLQDTEHLQVFDLTENEICQA